MPADNFASTLVRILDMLRSLPRSGPGATADDILGKLVDKGYDVQKRTVERDLKTLKDAFGAYIKCNDKSRPYGWRWHDGAEFEVVSMSVTEALSLHAIDESIQPLLPASVLASLAPRFQQARATLAECANRNRLANWASKVRSVQPALPIHPPHIDPGVLAVTQECLLSDEVLKCQYRNVSSDQPRELLLHPLALVQRGPVTYLVAMAQQHENPYLFAAHRILSAERTYLPARRLPSFNIDAYIADGHLQFGDSETTGEEIKMVARVSPALMRILSETPLSCGQCLEQTEEGWLLTATIPDTHQLRWWILSQGTAVEILAPQHLRERIADTLAASARLYT